jgi:hypothetical protein
MNRRLALAAGITALLAVSVLAVARYAFADPIDLYDGLIAWWGFDEPSGSVQYDAHSGGLYTYYHLTNNNTVQAAPGKIMNAASFNDADNDYLSSNTVPQTANFTVAAWVYLDDNAEDYGETILFGDGYGFAWMIDTGWDAGGYAFMAAYLDGIPDYVEIAGEDGLAEGWHFIVAWCDGSVIYMQVDNDASMISSSAIADPIINVGDPFLISSPTDGISHRVDQVGLWDRPLTAMERAALFNHGNGMPYTQFNTWILPTSTPPPTATPLPTATPTPLPCGGGSGGLREGLVAYWDMDEESGTRNDSTAYNHDLADNNSVGYTTTAKYGYAAIMQDSSYEYLSHPNDDTLYNGGDYSISAWIMPLELDYDCWIGSNGPAYYEKEIQLDIASSVAIYHRMSYDGNMQESMYYDPELTAGTWYHVVIRHQCNDSMSMSVNGTIIEESISGKCAANSDNAIFTIGRRGSTASNYASIIVDEVAMWDRAISDEEISTLYNGGNGITYEDTADFSPSGEVVKVVAINGNGTPVAISKIGAQYDSTADWDAGGSCDNCDSTCIWRDTAITPTLFGAAIEVISDTQTVLGYTGDVGAFENNDPRYSMSWNIPFAFREITFAVGSAHVVKINATGETPAHLGYGLWDASGLRESGYQCHDTTACEIRIYPQTSDLYAGALIYLDEGQSIASVTADPAAQAQTGGSGYYYIRWPIWSGGYHTATVGISAATPTPTATPTETPTPTPDATRRPTLTPTPETTGTPLPTTTPTPMGTATPVYSVTLTPIPTVPVTASGWMTYQGPVTFSWSSTASGLDGVMIDTGSIMGSVLGEATDVINLTNQDNALWVMAALSMALLVLAWAIDTVKNPR